VDVESIGSSSEPTFVKATLERSLESLTICERFDRSAGFRGWQKLLGKRKVYKVV
jgi:hypothetical protein